MVDSTAPPAGRPLQNRVLPTGQIVADPARALLIDNQDVLGRLTHQFRHAA